MNLNIEEMKIVEDCLLWLIADFEHILGPGFEGSPKQRGMLALHERVFAQLVELGVYAKPGMNLELVK